MGPFLVVFLVLEVGHSGVFLPKYAPKTGKKKIYMYIKNDHVHVNFVNLIFRNFALNDDVKSFI